MDSQIKETEALKKQIAKPKQLTDSGTMYFSIHDSMPSRPHVINAKSSSSHFVQEPHSSGPAGNASMIDEVVDLRVKLKEAHAFNEELKASFQNNLNQLQMTIKECIEDRDKILAKK